MKNIMEQDVELDAAAAHAIAAAMREVAGVDGRHPEEEALIAEFEADLPGDRASAVDFTALTEPAARTAFLRSVVLVAFADGQLSDAERDLIRSYVSQLGMPETALTAAVTHVASVLLTRFAGVKIYRDQVIDIGTGLGLDKATIERLLG